MPERSRASASAAARSAASRRRPVQFEPTGVAGPVVLACHAGFGGVELTYRSRVQRVRRAGPSDSASWKRR